MSSLQQIAIAIVGILVIVAIGVAIVRDARRHAPVADPDHPDAPEHHRRSGGRRKRDRRKAVAGRRQHRTQQRKRRRT